MFKHKRSWCRRRNSAVASTPTPPVLLAITDTFTRANKSLAGDQTETGSKYWLCFTENIAAGTVSIVGNTAKSVGSDGYGFPCTDPVVDCECILNVVCSGVYAVGFIYGFGRVHCYIVRMTTAQALEIYKVINGTVTLIASGVNAASGSIELKGTRVGNDLFLYENGVQKLTVTNSEIASGVPGFTITGATGAVSDVEINEL